MSDTQTEPGLGEMKLRFVVLPKWWLKWYVIGVALVSHIFDYEPDWERVRQWGIRGHKYYIVSRHGRLHRIA